MSLFLLRDLNGGGGQIISTEKENIDVKLILKGSPLELYLGKKGTEDNLVQVFEWCQGDLETIFPSHIVHCSLDVSHKEKKLYFVIGLQKKEKKTTEKPRATPSSILLEYKLIALYDTFYERIMKSWGGDTNLSEIVKKDRHNYYRIGFIESALDKEAENLFNKIPSHKVHLLNVIMQSVNEKDKRYAINLLGWANLNQNDISFLIKEFSWQTSRVQGKIAKLLNLFSFFINEEIESQVLKKISPLINNIDYETRTEALSLTYTLLKRSPILKKQIDVSTAEFIKYIANHSIVPNEKASANAITLLLGMKK